MIKNDKQKFQLNVKPKIFTKMKTKILSFLVLVCLVLIGTSAYAGGDQTPSPGQTETYSVTAGLTSYVWHIYQGTAAAAGTTPATADTHYSGNLEPANSITIKWLAASAGNNYYIWVQGTDANGCLTDPQKYDITVNTATVCIATDATVVGGVTPAAPTNINQCSLLTDNTTGSAGSGYGDVSTFYVTLTGGVPNVADAGSGYTVTYTIASAGGATATVTSPANLVTDGTGAGALALNISAIDYPVHFTKTTSGDLTVTVTVTKVTYNGVDIAGTCNYTIAVKQLPVIAF